jgi:DNA replication protein DnaC
MCGPTGVGKSHLANALAIEALKREQTVLYRNTQPLLMDLHAARASGLSPRLLARVLTVRLLILDDFGLQPLLPQAAQDLYDLLSERYEHGSVIVTSNCAYDEWPAAFGNDLLASAALDRLTHHAHSLIIRGESYRQRCRRKEAPSTSATAPVPPTAQP